MTFPGMTPDIELKPHQKNAIAHILYGNNTLLEKQLEVYQAKENEIAQEEEKQLEQIPVKRRISWSSFFHDSKIKRKEELDIQEQAERERLMGIQMNRYSSMLTNWHRMIEEYLRDLQRNTFMIHPILKNRLRFFSMQQEQKSGP